MKKTRIPNDAFGRSTYTTSLTNSGCFMTLMIRSKPQRFVYSPFEGCIGRGLRYLGKEHRLDRGLIGRKKDMASVPTAASEVGLLGTRHGDI